MKKLSVTGGDWLSIPITVQEYDDKVLASCNHAGATHGKIELNRLEFDPNYGNYLPNEYSRTGLICDKCPAWLPDGEEDWCE